MEEKYLTPQELSEAIRYSRQTLYNLINKNIFVLGEHYLKPSSHKILFVWSAVQKWLNRKVEPVATVPAKKKVAIVKVRRRIHI